MLSLLAATVCVRHDSLIWRTIDNAVTDRCGAHFIHFGSSSRLGGSVRKLCVPGICRVAPLCVVCATGEPGVSSIGKLHTMTGAGVSRHSHTALAPSSSL